MHYEINVSLNGQHLFATAPRSCVTIHDARRVFGEILRRFPTSEGFAVTVQEHRTTGHYIDLNA